MNYLNGNPSGEEIDSLISDSMNMWLGLDMSNTDDVLTAINGIEASINGIYSFAGSYKYDTGDDGRNSNAYVKNRQLGLYDNTIYFGSGLNIFIFGNNRSGYTLDGTLFHEATHVALGTNDVIVQRSPEIRRAYSVNDCLSLS